MNIINDEIRQLVLDLRLMDDTFFSEAADDLLTCQEMLRTFLGDKHLIVVDAKTQVTEVGLSRQVKLDAKCKLFDGTFCNVEVQKDNINDDVKRMRYHTSIITVNGTPKGTEFKDIPGVVAIYISEYDALGNGQRVTEVRRCQKVDGEYIPLEDGELIIFANTVFSDEELADVEEMSDVDRLLMLFMERDVFYDERFPNLSNRVRYFKEDTEGVGIMCKAVEEYAERRCKVVEEYAEKRCKAIEEYAEKRCKEAEEDAKKRYDLGISQGITQGVLHTLFGLYKEGMLTLEKCSEKSGLSEREFLLQCVEY